MAVLEKRLLALYSSIAAHVLAWMAFLFLALWPFMYRGVAFTADGQSVQTSDSLIEVNGFRVLAVLIIPVVITGVGLALVYFTVAMRTRNKVYLWIDSILLLAFCVLGIWSIGVLYFPSAIAAIVAAFAFSTTKPIRA